MLTTMLIINAKLKAVLHRAVSKKTLAQPEIKAQEVQVPAQMTSIRSLLRSVRVVGATALLAIGLPLSAQAETLIPAAPELAASSWILMDAESGKILAEHNADEQLPPASLTKMMTAYLVEHEIDKGNLNPSDKVRISEKAWRAPGSRMFIREGTFVEVEKLLHGVIIQSGNDASVALAEHLAGSESSFADLMNQFAQRLGMTNTHYMNATGLPAEGHHSTAHDLAILARHIIEDYPDHYQIYSQRYFTYNDIRQANRNRLLWRDNSVDGLKTGHTDEAGYCLVASAKRNDMRLISVVMGTKSDEARTQESQKLLAYGFRYFDTRKLYEKYEPLNTSKVWSGAEDEVQLGLEHDLSVTIPRGREGDLKASLEIDPVIKAPVQAGQSYGRLVIRLDDKEVAEKPLVALQNVEQGGFFKRIWDSIVLFVMGLFS